MRHALSVLIIATIAGACTSRHEQPKPAEPIAPAASAPAEPTAAPPPTATAIPGEADEVPLAAGETLWKTGEGEGANPIAWQSGRWITLAIVQVPRAEVPNGKEGGHVGGWLRAVVNGKAQDIERWSADPTDSAWAHIVINLGGAAAFTYGSAAYRDVPASETFLELDWDDRASAAKVSRRWSGPDPSKAPAWVNEYIELGD